MESNNLIEWDARKVNGKRVRKERTLKSEAHWHGESKEVRHPQGWFFCFMSNTYIPVCNLKTCQKSRCYHHPTRRV